MKKQLVAGLAALALTAPVGIVTTSSADASTLYYKNCTALARHWHHGVAKSHRAAMRQVRAGYGKPAYGPLARKVYWKNYKRLDRDRDGTACER